MAQKIPDVLSEKEQEILLKQPNPRYPTGQRNLAIMRIMLDGGLRAGEAINLRVDDIGWSDGQVKIVQGKGKKDRIVWLNDDALATLQLWLDRRPTESDRLFCTLEGKPLTARYLRTMIKRYGSKAGIVKDVHPHMLRHTYATDLYRQTKNIRMVQKALGHASLAATMIYTHIVDDEMEAAMKGFRD